MMERQRTSHHLGASIYIFILTWTDIWEIHDLDPEDVVREILYSGMPLMSLDRAKAAARDVAFEYFGGDAGPIKWKGESQSHAGLSLSPLPSHTAGMPIRVWSGEAWGEEDPSSGEPILTFFIRQFELSV